MTRTALQDALNASGLGFIEPLFNEEGIDSLQHLLAIAGPDVVGLKTRLSAIESELKPFKFKLGNTFLTVLESISDRLPLYSFICEHDAVKVMQLLGKHRNGGEIASGFVNANSEGASSPKRKGNPEYMSTAEREEKFAVLSEKEKVKIVLLANKSISELRDAKYLKVTGLSSKSGVELHCSACDSKFHLQIRFGTKKHAVINTSAKQHCNGARHKGNVPSIPSEKATQKPKTQASIPKSTDASGIPNSLPILRSPFESGFGPSASGDESTNSPMSMFLNSGTSPVINTPVPVIPKSMADLAGAPQTENDSHASVSIKRTAEALDENNLEIPASKKSTGPVEYSPYRYTPMREGRRPE